MALEFRPKGTNSFDLYDEAGMEGHYDETGHIGEIEGPEPEDAEELDLDDGDPLEPLWYISLWDPADSAKSFYGEADSVEEAKAAALALYVELNAYRRDLGRRGTVHVTSVPMGGQRRRR